MLSIKSSIVLSVFIFTSSPLIYSSDQHLCKRQKNSLDGYPRKRQKLDELGSFDQVDIEKTTEQKKEELRHKISSKEEACIVLMHMNKLNPDKFHKVLQVNGSRYYKDAQGCTWWDHVKFVNNSDLLQVLIKNKIPMHY